MRDDLLAGTRWVVTALEADSMASSVPDGVAASLTFGADGRLTGNDGCNGFGGRYEVVDERTIRITERVQSLKRCRDAVMVVAGVVGAAITGEVTYLIEGDRLTLTAADGTGIVCRPAAPG